MINKDETIISTYGASSKEPGGPGCARFGGSSVTPGDPGKGADAVVEATTAARAIALDPRMRDQR
jgi:hypothetical protein